MDEFNIIKYLNDIQLQDIISLFIVTTKNGYYEYSFEAVDQNNEFVSGSVCVYSDKVNICYRANNGLYHQYSSKLIFYNQVDYDVITEYSTINSDEEKSIINRKIGKNIPKRNLFGFKENKINRQKTLLYY